MKRFRMPGLLNIMGFLVVIYLVVILAQTIKKNYDLQQQITSMNDQIALLKQKQQTLTYNIAYYQSSAYQDRAARSELGLQKPGESVIILPHPADTAAAAAAAKPKPKPQSNARQWLNFLTGKS